MNADRDTEIALALRTIERAESRANMLSNWANALVVLSVLGVIVLGFATGLDSIIFAIYVAVSLFGTLLYRAVLMVLASNLEIGAAQLHLRIVDPPSRP